MRKKFLYEPASWFSAQIDYNGYFSSPRTFTSLRDLLKKVTIENKKNLFYFPVLPDDKTIGYNFLVEKVNEKYIVRACYSLEANLKLQPCVDITLDEIKQNGGNTVKRMVFSRCMIELWEECGELYQHQLEKGSEKYKLWGEIWNKYK